MENSDCFTVVLTTILTILIVYMYYLVGLEFIHAIGTEAKEVVKLYKS